MISRTVFILNGKAGSGKDTFVELQKEYAFQQYMIRVSNISTVDRVKEAAKLLGWNGVKDDLSRKFLSDLKDLSVTFCDGPAQYCYRRAEYLENNEWLYIHCREPKEIEKMQNYLSSRMRCYTVLIDRDDNFNVTSNHADVEVNNYKYDFIIDNNSTLDVFAETARSFVDKIVNSRPY